MATPAASTGNTSASNLPAAGGTSESTISSWAGPYITNMLGKAQAVANEPYQVYQGPMTAGQSNLQSKVFQGLGGLSFPGNLGQSFASPMGGNTNNYGGPGGPAVMPQQGGMPQPQVARVPFDGMGDYGGRPMPADAGGGGVIFRDGAPAGLDDSGYGGSGMPGYDVGADGNVIGGDYTGGGMPLPPGYNTGAAPTGTAPTGIAGLTAPQTSQQPSSIAQSYMNPYLESVLAPQMEEMRRQAKMNLQPSLAKLTQAGGFGGGRQAIMESEAARNLLSEQNKTVGQGYANAFDKAMGQFNTEQGQSKDLVNMLANAGAAERGIEQEGITADYNEFLAQRDDPMKKTQYLQSMLQGLPYQTVTNTPLPKSGIGQLVEAFGGMTQLEDA